MQTRLGYFLLRKWIWTVCFAFSCTLFNRAARLNADESSERIDKIKAAIVYHVVKFVVWPKEEKESARQSNNLSLCLIGQGSLNEAISNAVEGKEVQKRKLKVIRVGEDLNHLSECHIVFVDRTYPSVVQNFAKLIGRTPVLSVCDVEEVEWGRCIVQVYEEDNRARIAIDQILASEAGLQISSELLALARVRTRQQEQR